MENRNEYEHCKIWYLTIQGTDIQEIIFYHVHSKVKSRKSEFCQA